MARTTKQTRKKTKAPQAKAGQETRATVDEFELKGMGVAPKE